MDKVRKPSMHAVFPSININLIRQLSHSYLNIMYRVYYVLLLILYGHYPVALGTLHLQLHVFLLLFFFVLFHIFHVHVIISGVGTGGSGGSMNRGPRAPGAPSSGAIELF